MQLKKNSLIKGLLASSAALLFSSTSVWAQQSFGGEPLSFATETTVQTEALRSTRTSQLVHNVMPDFNHEDLLVGNDWQTNRQAKPFQIGRVMPYELSFAKEAQLISTVGDKKIYRLVLNSEGTPVGVNVYYNNFLIPKGGKLYIYTPDREQVLGAYTYDTHPTEGAFATEPLAGSTLILEYERPIGTEMPTIEISGMGYFFRPFLRAQIGPLTSENNSDMFPSAGCQVNINCSEGDDWQTEKAGVVSYAQVLEDGGVALCSGNLVMTTEGDFQPYILTAAHCAGEGNPKNQPKVGLWNGEFKIPDRYMDQWIFAFHYEKPHCSNGESAVQFAKTMTGCRMKTYLTSYGKSDGMLLLLNRQIPDDYRVYYNGWDRSSTVWNELTGIHHPAGDAKKISVKQAPGSVKIGQWTLNGGGTDDHFIFAFTEGTTEGGSSGSSIFNKEKRQVGTLTGGSLAICSGYNYYGRLHIHWDKYKDGGKEFYRMDKFLDPKGKGNEKVDGSWKNGYLPLLNLSTKNTQAFISEDGKEVRVTWEALPKHSQNYPISYVLYKDGKKIKETTETSYSEPLTGELQMQGVVAYKVVARYQIDGQYVPTAPVYLNVYTGSLLKEIPAKTRQVQNGLEVSWRKVQNTQTISKLHNLGKGQIRNTYMPKATERFTAWVVDAWSTDRFNINNETYISQIDFIPADPGKNVTLVIKQKKRNYYVEVVSVPEEASTKEYYSHALARPFLIDPNEILYVGFQVISDTKTSLMLYRPTQEEIDADKDFQSDASRYFVLTKDDHDINVIMNASYLMDNYRGYLPMKLILSSSKDRFPTAIGRSAISAPIPAKFPEVKKYIVYKNGQKLQEVDGGTQYFIDEKGTASDTYTIGVEYGAGVSVEDIALNQDRAVAYPATFTDELSISNASTLQSIKIYNVAGQLVESVATANITSTIATSHLAQGQYVVVFETLQGERYTQKVIKK